MRRAVVRLSSCVLADFFSPGRHSYRVVNGIPDGCRVIDARFDGYLGVLEVVVAGEGLREVPDGDQAPQVEVTVLAEHDPDPEKEPTSAP